MLTFILFYGFYFFFIIKFRIVNENFILMYLLNNNHNKSYNNCITDNIKKMGKFINSMIVYENIVKSILDSNH